MLSAILEGRARGKGQMPALLYQGSEAEDVADFVAAVAGPLTSRSATRASWRVSPSTPIAPFERRDACAWSKDHAHGAGRVARRWSGWGRIPTGSPRGRWCSGSRWCSRRSQRALIDRAAVIGRRWSPRSLLTPGDPLRTPRRRQPLSKKTLPTRLAIRRYRARGPSTKVRPGWPSSSTRRRPPRT